MSVTLRGASDDPCLASSLSSLRRTGRNRHALAPSRIALLVQPVDRTTPEGVDFGWVMQMTFVTTILVGSPIVALLSLNATLPTWGARAAFAIRVGAVIWFVTAIALYVYAKRTDAGDGGAAPTTETED